jgi:hypothetical protein
LVGFAAAVNAGVTVVVALTTWRPSATAQAAEAALSRASKLGDVAAHAEFELRAPHAMTTSTDCASVPVAGQVKGDVTSVVMFAGLASSGDRANGPSTTAAVPAKSLAEAVAVTDTCVSVPATVTRDQ